MIRKSIIILVLLITTVTNTGLAFGLTPAQIQSVYGDSEYYQANCTANSSQGTSSGTTSTTNTTSTNSFDNTDAENIAKQDSTNGTQVGYALYDSSGNQIANYNDTFENYGASITKSMLLVAYLNQLGNGTLSSSANSNLTAMIEQSSDSAANSVYGMLSNPKAEVEAVAQKAGMQGFKYNDSGDSLYALGQSQITAQDFAKFFSKIDTMFPSSQKSFALSLLSSISQQVGLLQAGLPGTVYSKEGWKPEPGGGSDPANGGSANPFGNEGAPYIVNQAAQFTENGTTYGVAVTVGGTSDETSGEAIVKNVVSALVSNNGSSPSSNQQQGQLAYCNCSAPATDTSVILTGADNGQKIWNYFLSQGYTTNQTAAIMGNLYAQDTTFNPEQIQIPPGGNSTTPTTQQLQGWGLAQWTPTSGGPNPILAAAQTANVPYDQLDTLAGQLTIIESEMTHTSATGASDMAVPFKQQSSLATATNYFYQFFEGGGAAAPSTVDGDAQMMLSYYGKGSSGSSTSSGGSSTTTSSSGNSNSCAGSAPNIDCTNYSKATSSLSSVRQNVVCIAEQQLAIWKSQPGYPWNGSNSYSESGYLKYSENRPEEWCADFVSWVYNQAGDPFSSSDWDLPAVQSIYSLNQGGFQFHPASSNYVPVPGDLAIHLFGSTLAAPDWAQSHVNIFISSSGGTATYIGGDQGVGPYPGGSIVSYEYGSGYYDNGIVGYVSPN